MKKSALKVFLNQTDGITMFSDRFHNVSKNKKIILGNSDEKIPDSWIKIHFKTYPRLLKQALPLHKLPSQISNLFLKRMTMRDFSGKSIDLKTLGTILFYSAGLLKQDKDFNETRRAYPSAGARYPLEVYILSFNVKDLNPGLYHYSVKENNLEVLLEGNFHKEYTVITGGDDYLANASFAIFITGVFNRTRVKYGERGYRYILLEAGHLAQNILLLANYFNFGVCPLGGFIDDKVNNLLDISKQKEQVLYMIVGGTK